MPKLYRLEIITPERQFFSGMVSSMIIDSSEGQLGILADHEPMMAVVSIGEIRLKYEDGTWHNCFASEGFMEIKPDGVVLMAQVVEWPDEIDLRRVQEAQHRAEERLNNKQALQEYHSTMTSLARAMARLRVKRSMNID